ncbi:MAG: Fe-S cluster assembly protein SufD [Nanoarchaeota archaeon]
MSSALPGWIAKLKKDALEKFSLYPPPRFRHGLTIRLDMAGFDFEKVKLGKPPGLDRQDFVLDLQTALNRHGEAVQKHLFTSITPADKISAFHIAQCQQVIVVYVPAGKRISTPIMLYRTHKESCAEHILVIAEKGSSVRIVEIDETRNSNFLGLPFASKGVEIIAMKDANVHYSTIQLHHPDVYTFLLRRARVGKGAGLVWNECHLGSRASISSTLSDIVGERGSVRNAGIFFASSTQQVELSTAVIHHAPHTSSDMKVKGAVTDKAKGVYNGLIHILNSAHNAEGFQESRMLMLSDECDADAIPNLEIDNPDVRCSHAASIGHLDSAAVFYMMSRGMTEENAKKLIIEGFFNPLLEQPELAKLKEKVLAIINTKITASNKQKDEITATA